MRDKKNKWEALVNYISNEFGDGKTLNLQAILFLIGINELGQGYRTFTKQERIDLLHIAICKLLSFYGYYSFKERDKEGWPHWKTTENLPTLKSDEQTILLKEAAVLYFEKAKINF